MITGQRSATRSRTSENGDWRWLQKETEGWKGRRLWGWGRRTEIQLACILLPIQINPFHLRAHQLSNWESDGDVRAARISTRPEVGAPLRPNQNTITFTARPDSCSNTFFFFFFLTQTLLDKCTYNHAHTEKYINFKSHMDKHILSRAIALWPISNYPQHRGRKMMYKTQFNILSYLWLWPMTGLSPLYSSSFQKLHLGGRLLAWKTKRQQLRLHIWAGSNASQAHFRPFSLMPQTTGPVCLQLHGRVHSFRCNNIRCDQLPGQHSLL